MKRQSQFLHSVTIDAISNKINHRGLRGPQSSMDLPRYPILEAWHIKINYESKFLPTQLKVRNQLGFMKNRNLLDGLQLDDDTIFNQKIQTITEINHHRVIKNGKRYLAFNFNAGL